MSVSQHDGLLLVLMKAIFKWISIRHEDQSISNLFFAVTQWARASSAGKVLHCTPLKTLAGSMKTSTLTACVSNWSKWSHFGTKNIEAPLPFCWCSMTLKRCWNLHKHVCSMSVPVMIWGCPNHSATTAQISTRNLLYIIPMTQEKKTAKYKLHEIYFLNVVLF